MTTRIKFTKMHGAGNDYIYVDTTRYPIADPEKKAIEWSKFHTGIGSDGLILIGLTDKTEITLDTLSGIKILKLQVEGKTVSTVTVDMGSPQETGEIDWKKKYPFQSTKVSMGNPHLVTFVDDITRINLPEIGPELENHPLFPDRTNVEFAQIVGKDTIRMRVWERGSGITQACGTGACATAVAAFINGLAGRKSDVIMDGGTVTIEWDETSGHILMTGPATKVFDGEIVEEVES